MTNASVPPGRAVPPKGGEASRATRRWLVVSAVLTLIGLALMVWSVLVPTPLPVMLAMTVGQAIGSAAFAIYLLVVVRSLRRELRGEEPPP
ncbi:MAG: hypothetical protein SFX73_01440 [Kofleriaceae bacterium]|nr:hypothetical protein [Kofleriaceae bacterium]